MVALHPHPHTTAKKSKFMSTPSYLSLSIDGLERPHGLAAADFRIGWKVVESVANIPTLIRVVVRGVDGTLHWRSEPILFSAFSARFTGPTLQPMLDYIVELVDIDVPEVLGSITFSSGKISQDWTGRWVGRARETFNAARALELSDLRARSQFDRTRSWRTMYNSPITRVRKSFTVDGAIHTARLVISAKGIYRAYINGSRVGDEELAPGWTDYENRIFYQNFDICEVLAAGPNSIAIEVADGWWSGGLSYDTRIPAQHYGATPAAIAEIHVTYADGTKAVIPSDESWSECPGEILYADLLMGELHDLTCSTVGWTDATYLETKAWEPAGVDSSTVGALVPSDREPVKVVRTIAPTALETRDGIVLADFGQNFAGRVRLRLRSAPRGHAITIRHGEVVDGAGNLYTDNLRSAESTDVVIASGAQEEQFEPRFTFHGFRYVEIEGLKEPLAAGDLVADVLSTDLRPLLDFQSGHTLVNSIYSNIDWGLRSNFVSVPTDCPQRDERLGWSADVQVFAPTASYLTDSVAFLRSWLVDFSEAQLANGQLPDVAPKPPKSENFDRAAPAWGDAITILPWHLYEQTGDDELLRQAYPHMRLWLDYVIDANPSGIWENRRGNDYGDWLSVDETTSKELIATSYLARSVDLASRAASVLSEFEDIARFEAVSLQIKEAYLERYVVEGRLVDETQTAYALALHFDLIPESLRSGFGRRLAALIEDRGHRLTTGFLGISVLAPVLSSIGRSDLAFDLLLQTEFPSWGYSIAHGATTIWERWDAWTEHAGFQSAEMNSFNHYSLGSIGSWMVGYMAGIRQPGNSVGYASILIAPEIDARVGWVDVTFSTPFGPVRSAWSVGDGAVTIAVEVPYGQVARVVYGSIDEWVEPGAHSWTVEYAKTGRSSHEVVAK